MRPILLTLALVVSTGSASALGISFSLPSLEFPPKPEIVTQDCFLTSDPLTTTPCVSTQ